MSIEKSYLSQITHIHWVTDTLVQFCIARPTGFKFVAGQFARLGLPILHSAEQYVFRAFSMVSSPYDTTLHFMATLIPNGAFSDALRQAHVGDAIYIEKIAYGYLTLDRFQYPAPHTLWLLATGTGVAPFLSMLQSLDVWQQYQHIILAYSTRHNDEQAIVHPYLAEATNMQQLATELQDDQHQHNHNGARFTFIPMVTRTPDGLATQHAMPLSMRITTAIHTGALEQAAHTHFSPHDHILICGNPHMVDETRDLLKTHKQLTMNRRGEGNIAVENYW